MILLLQLAFEQTLKFINYIKDVKIYYLATYIGGFKNSPYEFCTDPQHFFFCQFEY